MKIFTTLLLSFLVVKLHAQLPTWTHSGCKGIFAQTGKKSANNLNIWQEGNFQFTYEEISRSENEVILNDLNGRGMQVKIAANACYWKYPNDANWNMLYSGVWAVSPTNSNALSSEQNCENARKLYLEKNADVKNASLEPWVHYLVYGKKEGRKWPSCSGDVKTTVINNLTWMASNLNVDKFQNGDPIPEAKTIEDWKKFNNNGSPCWAYYEGNAANGEIHGKIYNGYALMDSRGLAPTGWHVATEADWLNLTGYNSKDQSSIYFGKLIRGSDWNLEGDYTNELKFNATPSGAITINQEGEDLIFDGLSEYAAWWTSSIADGGVAFKTVGLNPIWYVPFDFNSFGAIFGRYVRCVKD
jgi:uncharacterized protein (TIGR02145 family)